ncbi:MAG: hypothetical protein GXW90_08605 [Tepidanaerobacter acetatoxydans]|uniref:DUF6147 family protein n=1 Tax=Tepidanaerobacter acetatoxydans TaxID=499229 RepID=UPI0026EBC33F|nr:DUF6147 family protein [Tepidanaerobacter acetatoxydans]NLU10974.1 hypothetical protein [Tepidanaerobacter acetatoxydans]
MWKNSFKVLAAYTILCCIFVTLSGVCLAQDKLKEAYASNHTKVSLQAQQYLWEGYSKIRDNEDGTVTVSGHTKAYENVDLISVTLHLQVEDKTSWKTVRTWSYEDTDTDYVKGLSKFRIDKGKKYRIHAIHEVWNGKVHERETSTTKWVIPQ